MPHSNRNRSWWCRQPGTMTWLRQRGRVTERSCTSSTGGWYLDDRSASQRAFVPRTPHQTKPAAQPPTPEFCSSKPHKRARLVVQSTQRYTPMSRESRRLAGILLVILPTVIIGGVSILTLLVRDPAYAQNKLRQDLSRAGHAHAGVLLAL